MSARSFCFARLNARLYYGWIILFVASASMFASAPGQSHTFSLFVDLIAADLGLSKSTIAASYAVATLIAASGLSIVGRQIDRFGARRVTLIVTVALGIACIGFGAIAGILTLTVGFMALRFLGQGSMMLGGTNLVAQWFDARRGLAMSAAMLGFAASMAVHPILSQWLIELVGWRQAWVWLGVSTWVIMLPLLWLLAHDKPEPLGLRPDGPTMSPVDTNLGGPPETAEQGLTLRAALRTPAFWIIAAGAFSLAMLTTALFFFQVSIFEQRGLGRVLAASMFSLSAISMAAAMPVVGWLLDRVAPKLAFAAALVLLAVILVGVTFVSGTGTATIYAIVLGVSTAGNMTLWGYMWPRYFGRKFVGSIQGAGQTVGIVGAALGPLPLGVAFDIFGTYDGALRLAALLPLAAAVLALFLVQPKMTRET